MNRLKLKTIIKLIIKEQTDILSVQFTDINDVLKYSDSLGVLLSSGFRGITISIQVIKKINNKYNSKYINEKNLTDLSKLRDKYDYYFKTILLKMSHGGLFLDLVTRIDSDKYYHNTITDSLALQLLLIFYKILPKILRDIQNIN